MNQDHKPSDVSHKTRTKRFRGWHLAIVLATGLIAVGGYALAKKSDATAKDSDSVQSDQAETKNAETKNKDEKAKKSKTKTGKPAVNPFPGRFKAPSLDGGTEWLNTSGEITWKDLRGKIVLLDFWTYCCINCMHVLPDLKFLEQKYPNEVVVIGVHSAKFDNEKDSENIRRAIVRYEIEHPVINDSNMTVWRKFQARSWPTLVMIDPKGEYIGYLSGEGNREVLDHVIAKMIAYHKSQGTLDQTPIRFDLERNKLKSSPLKFPGKVLADPDGDRLFISDSNHNRIVITTLDGKLLDIIGSGAIGSRHGSYDQASFDHPQGMALVGETLYVADTENHLIRAVDLKKKTVSTLAGTGQQPRFRTPGGKLREAALNSPWALRHVNGTLFIAMAGPHQIWHHKLGSETVQVYAGTGREDITDGPLKESALAQPSGIATDGKFLYVADSEGSAIRKISVDPKGQVTTVAGPYGLLAGRALFEFGDIDGVGGKARLQHPLGVVHDNGTLYVADSYNHKIKKIDLKTRETTTWLGNGKAGAGLNPPQFSEPAGVSIAAGKLFVADTNNHRICVASLKTGKVSPLAIAGLKPPKQPKPDESDIASTKAATKVEPQSVAAGELLEFEIAFRLPEGYKLNKLAAVTYKLKAVGNQNLLSDDQFKVRRKAKANDVSAVVSIPTAKKTGKATLELAVTYSFCRGGVGGLCKLKTQRWIVPVELKAGAKKTRIKLSAGSRK